MDSFEQMKYVWHQQTVRQYDAPDIGELKRNNVDNQQKLERTQLTQAALLFLTAVFLTWMSFFSSIVFRSALTYIAVVCIILTITVQSFIALLIYRRLHRIDVTASVTQYLDQWKRYYDFRQRLIRINLPIYYILLNGAFGLYFIEILGGFSPLGRTLALVPYVAWMLYAYFVLGKRALQKENARLESIISNLQLMERQLINEPGSDE